MKSIYQKRSDKFRSSSRERVKERRWEGSPSVYCIGITPTILIPSQMHKRNHHEPSYQATPKIRIPAPPIPLPKSWPGQRSWNVGRCTEYAHLHSRDPLFIVTCYTQPENTLVQKTCRVRVFQ